MRSSLDLLIVDDNASQLHLVRALVRELGFSHRCYSATSGKLALDFLNRRPPYEHAPRPNLILLDFNMPEMSGCEVLQNIKGDPEFRSIPIIMLSSSRSLQDVNACYQGYANAYLHKPFDLEGTRRILEDIDRFWSQVEVPG